MNGIPTNAPPIVDGRSETQDFLLLHRVAQRIGSILDLDALLEQIVDDVARTFGYTRSAVLLWDESAHDLTIAAVRGWTSACSIHQKGDRMPIERGMIGHVAATGRTYYAPDVSTNPHYIVSEDSTRSEVDVPIVSKGRLIGVFNAQHSELDAFPPHRIQLLEALAGHLAVAIENARLFERERIERTRMTQELADARAIQTRLFPARAPQVSGFRITGLSQPCLAVGGDWFDYIPLPGGRLGLVLGDVAGKGTGAALLMASTRSILRMNAERGGSPADVLAEVNRVLIDDLPAAKFVTAVYAVLDPARRRVTYANAGHLPPILVDAAGTRTLRAPAQLPLGLRDRSYLEYEVDLPRGSRLLLYSDGVSEARNPSAEEYGEARLLRQVGSAFETAETLLSDVLAFAQGEPPADDITLILVDSER